MFALLNLTGERRASAGPSRGSIIPALACSRDLDAVGERWSTLETASYAPFRLIVATVTEVSVFTRSARLPHRVPLATSLYCSSSLGDDTVTEPRRSLFAGLLATSSDPWHAQDRLHQHAWPDRRHLSVLMSRTDAATVSRTEVVLDAERVSMRYAAVIDGWPAAIAAPPLTLSRGRMAA